MGAAWVLRAAAEQQPLAGVRWVWRAALRARSPEMVPGMPAGRPREREHEPISARPDIRRGQLSVVPRTARAARMYRAGGRAGGWVYLNSTLLMGRREHAARAGGRRAWN